MLSNNIKYLRIKCGYSQKDLANKIGIKRARLGSYEEGRCEPDIKTLILFSDFFGVFVDMLIKSNCSIIMTGEMIGKIKINAVEFNKDFEMKKYDYAEKDYNKLPRLLTV